jgi:hypothetical protein
MKWQHFGRKRLLKTEKETDPVTPATVNFQ